MGNGDIDTAAMRDYADALMDYANVIEEEVTNAEKKEVEDS